MSTTERRAAAVEMYEALGLSVFPYDSEGMPFRDWPNPATALSPGRRGVVLQPHTATYGVVLDGHIVVIDVDADRGGDLDELESVFGVLPPTMTVTTPSSDRNLHLYFRVDGDPLRTSKDLSRRFPGIDFLGLGSHVKGTTSWRRLDRAEDPDSHYAEYTAASRARPGDPAGGDRGGMAGDDGRIGRRAAAR